MPISLETAGVLIDPAVTSLAQKVEALERELDAHKAREKSWQQREQELVDFVENAVVGLHKVGADGTILWANAADCRMLGYRPEEYIGRNIGEFHADPAAACVLLERLQTGEALRDVPATLRCKDGGVRHVLISSNAHFVEGEFANTRCFTRDVTEQRIAEAALLDARTRLGAVVESSEDAILTVDLDGRIDSWNRGATAIYGYGAAEILGKPITLLIPPELEDEERRIIDRLRAGERIEHYETVRLRKDGTRRDISLTVSPVRDASGRLVAISKIGRDITARKNEQREIEEEARRKDEFLAILSHELRNPLAPIRYALSLAKQPKASPEHRRRAEDVIERQVELMGRLLDDLFDVSRISRGQVILRKKWIDLTTVIGAAIDAARPRIDQKKHTLTLELPAEPLRLDADPVRITQVLTNLLTNAAKYTNPGGEIHLRAWRDSGSVGFAVRDNGIGIATEMMPRLFELFAQATPALHKAEGGLGIGLALVKGFVEMHGGTIEAKSDGPGRGSEFVVRLPPGSPPSRECMSETGPVHESHRRLRILVADDNLDSAETCASLLEIWGHEVRVAHNGREALELAQSFRPNVALLDIGMPHMNGYEVAEQLRARLRGAPMTLVAVTGWGQEDDKHQASAAGFDHHLTKPLDPARLQPLLEAI
jgi:PAS domain S-box-containing protein